MSDDTNLDLGEDTSFGDEEIVFLTLSDVIELHEDSIKLYSPGESLHILDRNLLESAVMMPQQTFDGQYIYPPFTQMAATYVFGLARNHAFENGNKRVAYAACSTFLNINGFRLNLTQDEATDLTLGIISHSLTRDDVVETLDRAIEEQY
jgi:death-on-curing protein